MSRPGRNARKARARMKREVMPTYAVALTRSQAARLGLPVLPQKRHPRKHDARPLGDRRRHEDRERAA